VLHSKYPEVRQLVEGYEAVGAIEEYLALLD
jgi:hypothetical protein